MNMSSAGKLRLMIREKKMMRYYDDMGKGKGNCTVGFGHLMHKGPCNAEELARKVSDGDTSGYLDVDIRTAENAIGRNVTASLTQEQFDALVSYTFNRGSHGAHRAFELINLGDFAGAAAEISRHVTASSKKKSVKLAGLVARRAEESAPFRSASK